MGILDKITSKNRVRKALRELAFDPSAKNYVALAREYVVAGSTEDVIRVCTEGLQVHPGNADLQRLTDRARQLQNEARIKELSADLKVSPRPAIWRELCEVLIAAGKVDRAIDTAQAWFDKTDEGEARYFQARALAERFFHERRSEDGMRAYEIAGKAATVMRTDPRPLEIQVNVASRCGAWQEARTCLARLLELKPGDPALEARFRSVMSMCATAKPLEETLRQVERSGRFADDEPETRQEPASVAVRPMLKELSSDTDVQAAVYLRGGTALVQGPRGATADRTARAVRELVTSTRASSRRMSMGRPVEVMLEGEFGSLLLSPGENGASAIWCSGKVKRRHEELLTSLSGMAASNWMTAGGAE